MIKLVLLCHQFRHRHEPKAVGGFRCTDNQVINQFQSYEIRTGLELDRRIVVSLAGRRIARRMIVGDDDFLRARLQECREGLTPLVE